MTSDDVFSRTVNQPILLPGFARGKNHNINTHRSFASEPTLNKLTSSTPAFLNREILRHNFIIFLKTSQSDRTPSFWRTCPVVHFLKNKIDSPPPLLKIGEISFCDILGLWQGNFPV